MAIDLQTRFNRILERSRDFGDGGREVLEVAYHTLAAGRELGRWPGVGLEDLWAHAIKEGRSLFSNAEHRWAKTGPRETRDMIGQTTIGPWQITVNNVKTIYGLPYGISPDWTDDRVFDFCRLRPAVQCGMICDYIQQAYASLGPRSPYAIQKYFWLDAYLRREIGQGAWDKSVLPDAPDGDWRKITPAMKANTGLYAKQILLGTQSNPNGLVWWLWVSGDNDAIREVFKTWRDQKRMVLDEKSKSPIKTTEPGGFAIVDGDLKYVPDKSCATALAEMLRGT